MVRGVGLTPEFDVAISTQRQTLYCEQKGLPLFAPSRGVCWRCGKNIYTAGGYNIDRAGETHITYCPFCNGSFTD